MMMSIHFIADRPHFCLVENDHKSVSLFYDFEYKIIMITYIALILIYLILLA